MPSSAPPMAPSSASTETPTAWAAATTWRVTAMFSSSGSREPSYITDVKPARRHWMVCSKLAPWSRCSTTGTEVSEAI